MKPWVNTDTKNKSSVGAVLSARAFGLWLCGFWLCIRWESAASLGLNKCVSMMHPGLCRSIALAGLFYVFTSNQLFGCFDAVAPLLYFPLGSATLLLLEFVYLCCGGASECTNCCVAFDIRLWSHTSSMLPSASVLAPCI